MTRRKTKHQGGYKQARSKTAGDEALDRMLELAEYEVNVDPYRGMLASAGRRGPWGVCQWQDSDEQADGTEFEDDSYRTVVQSCRCGCPSLVSWTREANELRRREERKRAGKGKRTAVMEDFAEQRTLLGRRREDPTFRCECDYNPLCLGSLGGAMDDILSSRVEQQTLQQRNEKASPDLDSTDDDDVIVVENTDRRPKVIDVDSMDSSDENESVRDSSSAAGSKAGVCGTSDREKTLKGHDRSPLPGQPKGVASLKDAHGQNANEVSENSAETQILADLNVHYPCDIYTTESITLGEQLELDPNKENAVYSKETAEQLLELRKSVLVDAEAIRSYFKRYIRDNRDVNDGDVDPADDYVNRLRRWHRDLLFANPLKPSSSLNNNTQILTLSMPPGIKNLGATCYLNTQLQCLAQNIAFLNGIFSWREPVINDGNREHRNRMNSVLSTMQLLLARMRYGAECTITTADFSDALGLENDEMQDPNEFARLLFERMHESFQQCSNLGNGADATEAHNLANLLPRIFHGVATYETTCLTCQQTSERNEGFMDLNLPIEKISNDFGLKRGLASIKEFLGIGRAADSDVQDCLDKYTCAELMDGENQYWCGICDRKQDAKRVVTFRELPPVLNVQLSRYVFDRKKLMKKKLTDKVLLPQILRVPKKESESTNNDADQRQEVDDDSPEGERQYVLCAVMKHQGNSAYRGHYVAEVMDWHTGKWYEFNDETVTVLSDGPSCSYVPPAPCDSNNTGATGNGDKSNGKGARLQGSADAYNLYYVDASFLAKSASDSIRSSDGHNCTPLNQNQEYRSEGNPSLCSEVARKVSLEREERYMLLAEMCLNDGKAADRLRRRRAGIMRHMILNQKSRSSPITLQSLPVDGRVGDNYGTASPVWVDGTVLRQFLSCNDGLDAMLNNSVREPLLRHKHLLCKHKTGFHSRIARRGKLLPREVYNAYVSLLLGEQMLMRRNIMEEEQTEQTSWSDDDVNDYLVTTENLQCKSCTDEYRHDLSQKLQVMTRLRQLYEDLDPKSGDVKTDVPADFSGSIEEEDEYYYVVSRKFCTTFRSSFGKVLKNVESFSASQMLVGQENLTCICEGLDALDLSLFLSEGCPSEENGLDFSVNGNITCEHGQCNVANNKRIVRYFPGSVWRIIQQVFPNVICHKRRLDNRPSVVGCEQCLFRKDEKARLLARLQSWATMTLTSREGAVQKLYQRNAVQLGQVGLASVLDSEPSTENSVERYLVHKSDIKLWRKGISLAKDGKRRDEDLFHTLRQLFLFPEYAQHIDIMEQSGEPLRLASIEEGQGENEVRFSSGVHLCRNLRSLLCDSHHRTLASSFVRTSESTSSTQHNLKQLADHIALLSKIEYFAFVASLSDLGKVLCRTGEEDDSYGTDSKSETEVTKVLLRTHHPRIDIRVSSSPTVPTVVSPCETFPLSLDDGIHESKLFPEVCELPSCCTPAADDEESTSKSPNYRNTTVETANQIGAVCTQGGGVSTNKQDSSEIEILTVNQSGSIEDAQKGPNANFVIRVFELDSVALVETNVSNLIAFLRGQSEDFNLGPDNLRRSSRKRKIVYPEGTVGENELSVSNDHNIAALRLLLYEKCQGSPIDQELSFVVPCSSERAAESQETPAEKDRVSSAQENASSPPLIINLPYEWNHRPVREIFEIGGISEGAFKNDVESIARPFLVRYSCSEKGNGSRKVPRRERQEGRQIRQEELLDSLLEMANIPSDIPCSSNANDETEKSNKNGNGTGRLERGFRGTFLHSTSHQSTGMQTETGKNSEKSCVENCGSSSADKGQEPQEASNRSADGLSNGKTMAQDSYDGISSRLSGSSKPPIVILDESDDDVSSSTSDKTGGSQLNSASLGSKNESLYVSKSARGLKPQGHGRVDDDIEEGCSSEETDTFAKSKKTDAQIVDRISPANEADEDELATELLVTLTGDGDITPIDESKCRDAVQWARRHNPLNAGIGVLKDSAYAKYLELSCE